MGIDIGLLTHGKIEVKALSPYKKRPLLVKV